jgi:hypothetical protein
MSKGTHQFQDPSAFPVPLTPQCSRRLLTELPAPPPACRACDFIRMDKSNESSDIYMPMLTPTLCPPSIWEERPGLQPRLLFPILDVNSECSVLSTPPVAFSNYPRLSTPILDANSECSLLSTPTLVFSSYPHFPPKVTSCPSPAPLDDDNFSLTDCSNDELLLHFPMAREAHLEGLSRKDPPCLVCPFPLIINGDSPGVRLRPRSLPLRSNDDARENSLLHLMPVEELSSENLRHNPFITFHKMDY